MGRPQLDLVAAVWEGAVLVDDRGRLPTVVAADGRPGLAQVLAAAGDPRGRIMAPSLRVEGDPRLVVHLVELSRAAGAGAGRRLDLDAVAQLAHPAAVADAIRNGLAEFDGRVPWPDRRPDWFSRSWLGEVYRWVDAQLAGVGRTRSGPAEPIAFWSLSAVLAVPTLDGKVYFKATSQWFRGEATITELLHQVAPARIPDLIAIEPDRAWMLMNPLPPMADERDPRLAPEAARAMAELQLGLVGRRDELAAAGAPDRTLEPTVAGLERVVEDSVELDQLTAAERAMSRELLPWLVEKLQALADIGLPYSIGHGDLHIGNVAGAGDRLVIFDWTDASITFPVLDAALIAQSAGDEYGRAALAAYAAVWREGYPAVTVDRALALAPVANAAFQLVSYEGIYRSQEPRTRSEMAGVVAGGLRRLARQWAERSGSPPSG